MPRKKDGMEIVLLPRPTKGEDGKKLLYARPASTTKWDMRALDDFAHKYRGMQKGELIHSSECLMEVITYYMRNGDRVVTPFGSFAPKLRVKGDFTDPKKVRGKNVEYVGIEFIPSKEFENLLGDRLVRGFRQHVEQGRKDLITDENQLIEILQQRAQKGYITIRSFAYHSGMKYNTARDWLLAHCKGDNPLLTCDREGRTLHFKLRSTTKEK